MPGTWRVPSPNAAAETRLMQALKIRALTARVLVSRSLTEPDDAARFMNPRLGDLRPPDGMPDLERAQECLEQAIREGKTIGVFGDYDVDGVTSAAIITLGLRAMGATVQTRVATRHAGYGFNPEAAAYFAEVGCGTVVTCDCGTSDHASIKLLRERGIPTVVIDHHQVPSGESPAQALINPHRADNRFPFKGLASCGIAFYLMAALRTRFRAQGRPGAAQWDPRELLDLVALGSIADVVPLQHENRILVAAGLRELQKQQRPGIRALAEQAEVHPDDAVDATTVSFRYAPRINAAGRLGDAQRALDVLLATNETEAKERALVLEGINKERQRIQHNVAEAAFEEAEALIRQADGEVPAAIVVGAKDWHVGVVGIVAAKLVDRYGRPAIVVGFENERGRGSARTVPEFDLYHGLKAVGEHIEVYGGHAAAAGLTVRFDRFAGFREAFVQQAARVLGQARIEPAPVVDAVAELSELDIDGVLELERIGPFGNANTQPLLALPGVTATAHRLIGNGQHLQLSLSQGLAVGDAIGFGMAGAGPSPGVQVDLLGFAEINRFRGRQNARVRLKNWNVSAEVS